MFIVSILAVAALLGISEVWWRKTRRHSELSRKFIHITVGGFVATWPFYISWQTIRLFSLLFLIGVGLSKVFNLFKAIHSVQRPTLGEIFFALAVGLTTLVTHNKWVYLAALLQMSLADGLAAVAGVNFGKGSRYKVLGHTKSVAGSLACLVMSAAILVFYSYASGAHLHPGNIIGLAAGVTVLENIGLFGLDNLIIPLLVAWALTRL